MEGEVAMKRLITSDVVAAEFVQEAGSAQQRQGLFGRLGQD